MESFQNRMFLPEIEIKKILKKRKKNIISLREEESVIKEKITKRAIKQIMRRKRKERKYAKRGKRKKMKL